MTLWPCCSDYREMPQLDAYDAEGLDDEADVDDLSEGAAEAARQAAEQEMARRDRREHGALPGAFDGTSAALLVSRSRHLQPRPILCCQSRNASRALHP
jgi:hypothetical protein